MTKAQNKTSNITKGGFLTTLGVILVYLSGIVPVNKASLLALASFIIPLSVLVTGYKNAITIYAATSLLSLLICGFKITVLSYIVFFGLYGLIKYLVEKLRKLPLEIILKLAFFNICLLVLFLLYSLFFPGLLKIKISPYLIVLGTEIAFVIYDYLLTLFINYVNRYILKIIK
ncbi:MULTISPECIES: hypothetical protein [Clostridium]|uniref:DUF2232 domain-containing protein n=2 Tax=Clostridium TaxID=1485 RepID=A0A3M0T445_9CLOT|nr:MULTISPECIES: hypothetical protein [Clostridium]ADK13361.1 putative membrane protein [Clostridium ljungdahlii DSM 13528]OAA88979.1 hypothetical protein WX45_02220 [Clostridium ljungdahlii DSM 13528]RMD04871.1 hypothetical protein D9O40_00525 [Clostridium autoethanogenum]